MYRFILLALVAILGSGTAFGAGHDAFYENVLSRKDDLRFSAYATVSAVQSFADDEAARTEAVDVLRSVGVTRIFLEVYRSGRVITPEHLVEVRDFFQKHSFRVTGGIATTPGNDFGVRQDTQLGWFNWQNPKTQEQLKKVMRDSAPVFDDFIVDDFFCTADMSPESVAAKGDRSWGDYRRELLSGLAKTVFHDPAKAANPNIELIIKFPQWYDLFHRFGYDIVNMPPHFDEIWVGTETRGSRTQRYGFTTPYMGFVNYRYFTSLHGDKVKGAWFDHGDCGEFEFIDQAYQSVLAGAQELIFFHYGALKEGHPDHAKLREEFTQLADLAASVRENPVQGIPAYKPPNSEAGRDVYIMDFLGMLGIPLIPVTEFPRNAKSIFLPTQAAADPSLAHSVERVLKSGGTVMVTPGLLRAAPEVAEYVQKLGCTLSSYQLKSTKGTSILSRAETTPQELATPINIASTLRLDFPKPAQASNASILQLKSDKGHQHPFLVSFRAEKGRLTILNTYTYTQEDFDRANEVLLSPQPIGLLDMPDNRASQVGYWLQPTDLYIKVSAPPRVTIQGLGTTDPTWGPNKYFIQNYNDHTVDVNITAVFPPTKDEYHQFEVKPSGERIAIRVPQMPATKSFTVPAHGRVTLEYIRPQ
jgi:hypothetical protein